MSVLQRLIAAVAGIALVLLVTITAISTTRTDANYQKFMPAREVVESFMRLAFEERKPEDAVRKYLSPDFVDHDPQVTGTRDSVLERLQKLEWNTAQPRSEVQHILVEGDYVAVHHALTRKPGDAPIAAVDLFRVKSGLIIEHWDVLQPMPEHSSNPHPMF
ncbi:MAG TPA: nuclear transport factor 2 family protein [Steroidobacteraceae bacterium]|nr:nuclear transport factor 2 family protein [Steroidobacteraceae bacterium]